VEYVNSRVVRPCLGKKLSASCFDAFQFAQRGSHLYSTENIWPQVRVDLAEFQPSEKSTVECAALTLQAYPPNVLIKELNFPGEFIVKLLENIDGETRFVRAELGWGNVIHNNVYDVLFVDGMQVKANLSRFGFQLKFVNDLAVVVTRRPSAGLKPNL
jgi:hypothetical protein